MDAHPPGIDGGSVIMSQSTKILLQATVLFALWMILSGTTNIYQIILGCICALVLARVNVDRRGSAPTPFPFVRLLVYLPWLFSRIVMSSLQVTKLILHPRLPIAPTLVSYPLRLHDHRAVVLLGNSVTLTPGTVTVEASPQRLLVHALDSDTATDLTSGLMERKVAAVFQESEER